MRDNGRNWRRPVVTLATLLVLSACGSSTDNNETSASRTETDETSTAPTTAPTKMTFTGAGNLAWLNVFVAHEEGIFERHGIESTVALFDVGFLGTEAVIAGDAQTASSVEFPMLNVLSQGAELVVLGVVYTANDQRILVDASIQTPDDLRGKKIGLIVGSAFEYAFIRYLEKHGVPRDEVEFVNVGAAEQVAIMARGDIDGFLNVEPVIGRAIDEFGDKVHLLKPGIESVYESRLYLQMNPKWVEENPEATEATVAAFIEANEFIVNNRPRAEAIGSQYLNMTVDEVAFFLDDGAFKFDVYWDEAARTSVETIGQWLVDQGRFNQVPAYDKWLFLDPLRRLAPESVS